MLSGGTSRAQPVQQSLNLCVCRQSKINVGKEYAGKFGNLYYHEGEGKLRFIKATVVDAEGYASLDFTHASDYVIVLGEDRTADELENPDVETPDDDAQSTEPGGTDTTPNGKEDDGNLVTIVIVILVIAAIAGGLFVYLKKNNKI